MRLKDYINEIKGINHISVDNRLILNKDCKKYLKLIKNTGPFYRGIAEGIEYDMLYKKQVRQDRKPMGTLNRTFKKLNKWLSDNGHVRRDKSVSVSSDESTTMDFGVSYLFFPIGNFDYTWLRAKDLNFSDFQTGWDQKWPDLYFEPKEWLVKMTNAARVVFPRYFTTNKGIEEAHNNGYEIWFNCKSYYITPI